MALNDTAQLAVKGTVAGQMHVHTLHFRNQSGAATGQGLIDGWQSGVRTEYRAIFAAADSPCQQYSARIVCAALPLPVPTEETEVAPNIVGSIAAPVGRMPPWIARVVSVRTALAGKSRRGRFFLGGVWEDQQDLGTLVAGDIARVQAYVDALTAAFITPATGTNGWRLAVHSPTLAAVPGTQCQDSSTLVTGFIVRDQLGSMKSRKAGSGS
jgi:hypothetical protein